MVGETEGRWVALERHRHFRICASCRLEWPPTYASCPACRRWLGDADRMVRESWIAPGGLPAGACLGEEAPGPAVVLASTLHVAAAIPTWAPPDGRLAVTGWLDRLRADLVQAGAWLGAADGARPGLMAAFPGCGDPADQAQRAVAAALRARELAADAGLGGEASPERLFFGINTGPAGVRAEGGRPALHGASLSVAGLLARCLGPGHVVASATTYRLARQVYEGFGTQAVERGEGTLPDPVYTIRGPRPVVTWRRQLAGHAVPLTGRDAELAELEAAWAGLAEGRGRVVHLVAEPGVGKSKLLDTFAARRSDGEVWRGWGACYGGSDLQFLRDLLAPQWLPAGLPRSEARAALRARLVASGLDAEPLHRTLGRVFGLEADHARGVAAGEAAAALVALATRAAARRPLAVLCDDLHWADGTSLQALMAALPALRAARVMVVLAYRPSLRDRFALPCEAGDVCLSLGPLAEAAAADLLAHYASDGLPRWRRAILQAAAGSPLYLEEAVGLLRDVGVLPDGTGFAEIALPPSLPLLLLRRVRAWSERQLTDLELAARVSLPGPVDVRRGVEAVERRLEDWLDRIESGGYVGHAELGDVLAALKSVEHRLMLLRWRLGVPQPRHSRLRAAMERLHAGASAQWQAAIRARAADPAQGTSAFWLAAEAAEMARLRDDRQAALDFYRLALSLYPAEEDVSALYPLDRLWSEIAAELQAAGHLHGARAALAAGLSAAGQPKQRCRLAATGACLAARLGRWDEAERLAATAEAEAAGLDERDADTEAARLHVTLARAAARSGSDAGAAGSTLAQVAEASASLGLADLAWESVLLNLEVGARNEDAVDAALRWAAEGGADPYGVRLFLALAGCAGPVKARVAYAEQALRLASAQRLRGWEQAARSVLAASSAG
jgi:hypothetical protein